MATKDHLLIAYCYDNIADAQKLISFLESRDLRCTAMILDQSEDFTPLEQLRDFNVPIYVLISDNFLRSVKCMKDGKDLLENFYIPGQLQPIITRGTYQNNQGIKHFVETKFERVGDVIAYMNYWQEKYLQTKESANDNLELKKENDSFKKIAEEIGDFLGILRNSEYLDFEQEESNNFSTILKRFNLLPERIKHKLDQVLDKTAIEDLEEARRLLKEEEKEALRIQDNVNLVDKIIAHKEKKNGFHGNADDYTDDIAILDKMAEEIERKIQLQENAFDGTDDDQLSINDIFESEFNEEEELLDSNETHDEMIDVETGITDVENQDTPSTDFEDVFHQPTESSEVEQNKLQLVTEHLENKDPDAALNELRQLIINNPDNLDLQFRFATILANEKGDHFQATHILEKILEDNNEYTDAYHLLAEIAENHKDYLLAKSYYEKVINLDKKYPGVHLKIAQILQSHFPDQQKLSLKYLKKAIKRNPRDAEAYYQYALLISSKFSDYEKGLKYLKKCLKRNPLHPLASYEMAKLYALQEKSVKAKAMFKTAVKINKEIDTTENRAEIGLKKKKKEIDIFDKIDAEQKVVRIDNQLDEVVLITGASSGIGKATAYLFAQKGYRLILTGRRAERLAVLKKDLKDKYSSRIKTLVFDVRNIAETKKSLSALEQEWSTIDILINNAGLALGLSPIHQGDIDHWDTMIDTNIKGLLYMTRFVSPGMVKRQSGHIINVCSTAGKEVYANGNVYCATKHAVDALTKSMRIDLHKHNIKVSQVAPAHVEETEFALVRFEGDQNKSKIYEDFNPLKSEDVAEAIYFLISRPKHVNVQDIVLMGTQQASSNHINKTGRIFD